MLYKLLVTMYDDKNIFCINTRRRYIMKQYYLSQNEYTYVTYFDQEKINESYT